MDTSQPFKKMKLKERQGFDTRGMRWLYRVLYPCFHCRVRIPEELRDSEEPVVFIANHYNVFGPISFVESVPLVSDIWMNQEIIDPESSAEALLPGVRQMFPFLTEERKKWFSGKLSLLAVGVLNRLGAIPVSRDQPSRLISTMRRSIAALEAGHNLLIFPETGQPRYSLTSVTPFYSGFAMLGSLYHRKTGKKLKFCPCYIDEQHRLIRMGEMVTYEPETDSRQETERVSDELNRRIREMAAENRGVEKEKTSPLRRTVLFFCNLARCLLLIPLITMLGLGNEQMILLCYGLSEGIRILFSAVCSIFSSSNRLSFLFSHGVGILTDISMMIYLAARTPRLRWILYMLILNGAVILYSNARTLIRYRRCAGVNYFDSLSANLLFAVSMLYLLKVRLAGMILNGILICAVVFLTLSAALTVAFNARIGQEEDRETSLYGTDRNGQDEAV
ncbi:MAG: hypothetical protein K5922_08385 [Clostridiales bacterium]|nr:hypothetical protein [Clostridiales bacterium]